MSARDISTRAFAVLSRRCHIVVLRASAESSERDDELPRLPTRDQLARDAMGLAPTMSPRDACMRVLARWCGLYVMRAAMVFAVVLGARTASAHSLDIGYLRIEPTVAGSRIVFDLDRIAAAHWLGVPDASLDVVRVRASELAALTYAREAPTTATLAREAPTTATGPCTFTTPTAEIVGATVRLTAVMACPPGQRTWKFPFVADTRVSATFELLVKDATTDRLTVVDRNAPAIAFGTAIRAPKPAGQGRSMFLIGGLLAGVMLAPLARFALRR